ncbi:MAG: glycosyltransferase family 4 protein [Anaerolineales bacterium]|nr:glycosyltransferase family 4 protein [Anaerolineales bacterium]HEY62369.1 glycosyltransferase family 4 protein [Anaerolineae bacterium]
MRKICLIPRLKGVGGMVSFQEKFRRGLQTKGIDVCFDPNEQGIDAVLVIGGTHHLGSLYRIKNQNIPIVQRLDGMNWIHRVRRTGIRHFIRAEYGNLILSFIRSRLADRIIYQSEFSREWWEREHKLTRVANTVIYNGVNLESYSPRGEHNRPKDHYRVLIVEGSLMGGYDIGLNTAIGLVEGLNKKTSPSNPKVELMVVGKVSQELIAEVTKKTVIPIEWKGLVPSEDIPLLDRSAHILYSGDINAACPNSAIEAIACGLPIVAFDTGALQEIVVRDAGKIVPYGENPWQLSAPNIPLLVNAALEILESNEKFRAGARKRAEEAFSLDHMVNAYVEVLLQ